MPHPSHRLDVQLVPVFVDSNVRVRAAHGGLVELGVVDGEGWPGPMADWLVEGGFARVRSDVHDAPRLWANQQGGFRATCPQCGETVVEALHRFVREPGAEGVLCVACSVHLPVERVDFRPPAAWGSGALVISDAGSASLTSDASEWLERVLGAFTVVWRRG